MILFYLDGYWDLLDVHWDNWLEQGSDMVRSIVQRFNRETSVENDR